MKLLKSHASEVKVIGHIFFFFTLVWERTLKVYELHKAQDSRGVPKCGVHVYNWPGSDVVLRTSNLHLRSVKAKTYGHRKTSSDSLYIGDLVSQ